MRDESLEPMSASKLQGRLHRDFEKALAQQIKAGSIQQKDEHVVRLALKTSSRGILTTDEDLAVGVGAHTSIARACSAWHVLDAEVDLPK